MEIHDRVSSFKLTHPYLGRTSLIAELDLRVSQYHGYIFFSAFIACLPVSLNLTYILYHDFPKKSSIELTDFPKILEVPSLTFYKYYIMNCGKSQILNLVRRVGVEPTVFLMCLIYSQVTSPTGHTDAY